MDQIVLKLSSFSRDCKPDYVRIAVKGSIMSRIKNSIQAQVVTIKRGKLENVDVG